MRLLKLPNPENALPILRAFAEVARVSSVVDARQEAMIAAASQLLLGAPVDVQALAPIEPQALAAAVPDEQLRRQVVQGMIVLSLLDEEAEGVELERIEASAAALAVAPAELENLRQLIDERSMALRLSVARRVWFVDKLRAAWEAGGFRWLVRSLATLKLMNDDALAGATATRSRSPTVGAFDASQALWAVRRGMEVNADMTED